MRPGVGLGWVCLGGRPSALAGAVVGDFDTDVRLICREGLTESFLLTWGEPVARGAQKKPDLVEGITLAPAVTGRVLLDATTHLTWSVTGERDDMEGIQDAGGVLELIGDGVLAVPGRGSSVAIRTPTRKSSPRSASQFSCAMPDFPGTRSSQAGRGMILPASGPRMPVSSRGPRRRRSW